MNLREQTYSDSLTVDRENGVIRGVRILGRSSKNGRVYSDPAMQEACGFYEGMQVNFDHPLPADADKGRAVMDGLGVLRECRIKDGAVYGDLHYLTKHPHAEFVAERAEKMPNTFGLSHNAEGVVKQDGQTLVVESIKQVYSVDLVGSPATNSGLFESVSTEERKPMKVVEMLRRNRRHPVAKLLLEQDAAEEILATAEVPAEEMPAEEASPEDQVAAAFRAMIMQVLDDDSMDVAAKTAKIEELLSKEEEVKSDVGDGEGGDMAAGSDATATAESVRSLKLRLDDMERKDKARTLLEEYGVHNLDADRRELLEDMRDEDTMRKLIESWPPSVRNVGQKPSSGGARRGGTYESLYESVEKARKRPGRRQR